MQKKNILISKSIPSDVKSYHEFCTFFGLKELIKVPTRTTTSSSTFIDHILASYPERVTQCRVIDVSLSDHQLLYCTRKISRIESGSHKQIQFRSFKHYTVDLFDQELSKLNFPNYQNYNEINEAYNDFIQKIMSVIDRVAPIKERRVKQNSQEWFDGEIAYEIKNRDKLFKKFKKSKLHIDKDIYNAARFKVRKMIFNKKRSFLEKKLSGSIAKPKDIRKALKSLGLPNKIGFPSCEVNALKINNTVERDANSVLEGFKNYYSTLAENLVKMLPKAPNKYSTNTVIKYYEHMIQGCHFNLTSVSEYSIITILKVTQVSKAAGLDDLSGSFL